MLVDAKNPFGVGRLAPRGLLREPVSGLRRAHAAVLTHADWATERERAAVRDELRRRNLALVLAEAVHVPAGLRDGATGELVSAEELTRGRWLAVSSLGAPESFERTLAEMGACDFVPVRFPDHHPYTPADATALGERVKVEGLAGIVTTEKDSVKIPRGGAGEPDWLHGVRCLVLEVDLSFISGQDALESLIQSRIGRSGGGGD